MGVHGLGGVLVVCAANVCRSPAAALTLARLLEWRDEFRDVAVTSAGVAAVPEGGACELVVRLREEDAEWAAVARAHRPRQLVRADVEAAAIVLAASRGVRSAVIAMTPSARRHAFTLREALRLGAGFAPEPGASGAEVVRAFASHADAARGLIAPPRPSRLALRARPAGDDIDDGHGRRPRPHRRAVHDAAAAAEALAAMLGAARDERGAAVRLKG